MHNNKSPAFSRREFISSLLASCAGILSPALLAGDLNSIKRAAGGPLRKGSILSLAQMRTLAALADIIIPRTETASASDTDAHGVIDDQLAHCHSKNEASQFITQLDAFMSQVQKHSHAAFPDLDTEKQTMLVTQLATLQPPFNAFDSQWFLQLKSAVVLAYYTSETGGTKELVYDPIPGGYNGHFKLSDNQGRAFSIYHI